MMKRILITVLSFLVIGCGTLEVGIEPTVAPPTDEPTTVAQLPSATAPATDEVTASPTNEPMTATPSAVDVTDVPTETPSPLPPTETSEPATATPTPAPMGGTSIPPHVTYLKDGNLWLWNETDGARLLYDNPVGEVTSADLNPHANQIAYIFDEMLHQIDTGGVHNVQLTTRFGLSDIHDTPGVVVYRYGWMPDGVTLLYNTSPPVDGHGFFTSDNLWSIQMTDMINNVELLDIDMGGNFYPSPDGSQIAVVRPGQIDVIAADGSSLRTVFTHEQILTYSEAPYYARPVWSVDGSALYIVMPPTAYLDEAEPQSVVWRVSADGSSQAELGTIPFARFFTAVISAETQQIAHLRPIVNTTPTNLLAFTAINDDALADTVSTDIAADELGDWSPDGQHIIFTPTFAGTPQRAVATTSGEVIGLGSAEQAIVDARWVNDQQLIVVRQNTDGLWEIVLRHLTNGDMVLIDTVSGPPPQIDVP